MLKHMPTGACWRRSARRAKPANPPRPRGTTATTLAGTVRFGLATISWSTSRSCGKAAACGLDLLCVDGATCPRAARDHNRIRMREPSAPDAHDAFNVESALRYSASTDLRSVTYRPSWCHAIPARHLLVRHEIYTTFCRNGSAGFAAMRFGHPRRKGTFVDCRSLCFHIPLF